MDKCEISIYFHPLCILTLVKTSLIGKNCVITVLRKSQLCPSCNEVNTCTMLLKSNKLLGPFNIRKNTGNPVFLLNILFFQHCELD